MIALIFIKEKPAEKTFCRSEDGSAGGGWGEECRAVRAKSAKPRHLLVQSRTPQKSFVFLLEEKIRRAQIQKCEQTFSLGWRAVAGRFSRSAQNGFVQSLELSTTTSHNATYLNSKT